MIFIHHWFIRVVTPIDLFLSSCLAGFAFVLMAVSLKAYRRHKEPRLAIVAVAFALYSLLALLVLVAPFFDWKDLQMSSYLVLLNLGILLSLYFAVLKR